MMHETRAIVFLIYITYRFLSLSSSFLPKLPNEYVKQIESVRPDYSGYPYTSIMDIGCFILQTESERISQLFARRSCFSLCF